MKLGYIVIYVHSVSETLEFYEKAFGFQRKFIDSSGDYGEIDTVTTTLAFASLTLGQYNFGREYFIPTNPDTKPLGFELAFTTENIHSAHQSAVNAGAISVQKPMKKPWGQTVSYVRSLEGTLIELCTPIDG
ncbi:VOC family protein [Xenorhabdus hominickii]|uniref:Glyoxalase n=1 Tax=Xenorhabdus hominickii TaxID=351679 RepID=A0A2G0Q355_XENHO|nr:VOC family protein [Xenorhabdus hominickii]AOM39866.1 glyoxalase [Xenorhabdus hominickii]PHM53653.1 glyoxalase [Xenorhabdus hominickii]